MKSSVPYVLPEARERIIELVTRGHYIPAIKLVRQVSGAELKDAKAYVDGLKGEAFGRVVPADVQAKARALIVEGRRKDAAKLVKKDIGLGSRAAKDFVDAIRAGRVPASPPVAGGAALSDRARALKVDGDFESAVALVCAETGMGRDEAYRFVDALGQP